MITILSSSLRFFPCQTRLFTTTNKSGPDSYANLGRMYEEKCQKVLSSHFKTPVNLVGGAGDGGIDLTWSKNLIDKNRSIHFIGQCKLKVNTKVGSEVCRGLEGSLSACPPGTVGCLITNNRPSTECLNRIKESVYPIMYMQIKEAPCCLNINEAFINGRIKALFPSFISRQVRTLLNESHVTFHFD